MKEKLTVLEKSNVVIQPPGRKQTTQNDNVLTPKTSSGDIMTDMLKKENSSLVRDLEEMTQQRDQLRHLVEEKEKEVERGRSKFTNLSVELQATQVTLQDSQLKVHRLELKIETNKLDIMKLERDLEKYKENAEGRVHKVAVKMPSLSVDEGEDNEMKPGLLEIDHENEREQEDERDTENEKENKNEKETKRMVLVKGKEDAIEPEKVKGHQQESADEEEKHLEKDTQNYPPQEQVLSEKDIDEQEDIGINNNEVEEVEKEQEEDDADDDGDDEVKGEDEAEEEEDDDDEEERSAKRGDDEVINDLEINHQLDLDGSGEAEQEKIIGEYKEEMERSEVINGIDEETNARDNHLPEAYLLTTPDSKAKEETQNVKEKTESTLEDLMSLLVASLRTTREMRPAESQCIVQNLNQVIVITKDSESRHERAVQSTQTMSITQVRRLV